jgi:hypothetical protein
VALNKKLSEVGVEIVIPRELWIYKREQENAAEAELNDLIRYLRDHRLLEWKYELVPIKTYDYTCEYCGQYFEKNIAEPDCCDEALAEWGYYGEE